MYRIGMFSQISKTTVKTLRYYDEVGLLKPIYVDEQTGYRYYATWQLFRLHEILSLRQMGFSIEETEVILSGHEITDVLERRKKELEHQYDEVQKRIFQIDYYIKKRREGMNYKAMIKEIPECIVFSKRLRIPNYDALMQVVPEIGRQVSEANPSLQCAEPFYCFNVYHDGEYKEKDIDVEVCEAVTEFGIETEGIVFKKSPAITAVCTMHKGPYSEIGAAYAYLFDWIEKNNYKVAANPRESFIDGIRNKESEEEWLTELQIPIQK